MAAGAAAATSSTDREPMVDRVKGTPACSAARTPATSPSVCIIRVNPVGAIPTGRADRRPAIVVDRSTSALPARIAGVSTRSSKAARLPWWVRSAPAAPST